MASLDSNTSCVYVIYNAISKKFYVGSAVNFARRLSDHRSKLRKERHINPYLQRSWNLHGEAAFEFLILERCKAEELLQTEQFYLDLWWGTGRLFNISPVAGASMKGLKHSEATRKKLSESHKGIKRGPLSDETKRKLAAANLGKSPSAETRLKMSIANKGKNTGPRSAETIRKMSEAQKGKPSSNKGKHLSDETRRKMSEARMGKPGPPHTEESKRKIGIASKAAMQSPAARRRISEANKGRPKSPEEMQNIIKGQRRRRERERLERQQQASGIFQQLPLFVDGV